MIVMACKNKNLSERLKSSSGGFFILIAKAILNEGGIIYGAAFTENFSVEHRAVERIEELDILLGSKYVLSKCGVYSEVENNLKKGRKVLFVGTPCQIYGLKKALKEDYDNLLMIDFICHGTPPADIWNKYLKEMSKGRKINEVSFRDKSNGWENFNLKIRYSNGDEYLSCFKSDLYMQGFVNNLILRECCYSCRFKGVDDRLSDITMGDLWGAKELVPNIFDDNGVSLVMARTAKGTDVLNKILPNLYYEYVDEHKVLETNWAALRPVDKHTYFDCFWKEYKKNRSVKFLLRKYLLKERIIRKIKKLI